MQLPDPLVIVIAVVVLGVVAGAVLRFTGRVLRALSSLVGVVIVVWLLSKLLEIDLPYLP